MPEHFIVEQTRDRQPRLVRLETRSYFDALDAFRTAAVQQPDQRFILAAVRPGERARMLSDSDTDNVVRVGRGLEPVRPVIWSTDAPYLERQAHRQGA